MPLFVFSVTAIHPHVCKSAFGTCCDNAVAVLKNKDNTDIVTQTRKLKLVNRAPCTKTIERGVQVATANAANCDDSEAESEPPPDLMSYSDFSEFEDDASCADTASLTSDEQEEGHNNSTTVAEFNVIRFFVAMIANFTLHSILGLAVTATQSTRLFARTNRYDKPLHPIYIQRLVETLDTHRCR